jgi:hypothetical protein
MPNQKLNARRSQRPHRMNPRVKPELENVQKRFDKLTKEKYDARREAEFWRQRAMEAQQPQAKPEPVAPVKLPTLEDTGYDEAKYQAAFLEYTKAQARQEAQAALAQAKAEETARQRAEAFEKRQRAFLATKPDYIEKVMQNESLPISKAMADVIVESEIGPEVAYYLYENPEQSAAIARLDPTNAAREIGRIEARIEFERQSRKAASVKPSVSQAPPPVPKLDTTEPAVERDPDKMSVTDWLKWREKQVKRRQG